MTDSNAVGERRRDLLLRNVVDEVQVSVAPHGFTLWDRGTMGEYRWVEFTRRYHALEPPFIGQQSLIVYHLADHQHIGARLELRSLASSVAPRRLASQLWRYEPGQTTTPEGEDLSAAMRNWVMQTLDASTN
jgi:hypothetical protein